MANFARPAGVTNPGDANPVDGYRGVQRGPMGAKNLVQIGGGQNTFGVAQPAGAGAGESAAVVGGVGQSGSPLLASGSFEAPSVCGNYTFSLANAIASTLTSVASPPNSSGVTAASISVSDGSFTMQVRPAADLNLDCHVDTVDVGLMVGVLLGSITDPSVIFRADLNRDGFVDGQDIQLFVSCLMVGACP